MNKINDLISKKANTFAKVEQTWFSNLFGFHEINLDLGVNTDRVRAQVTCSENKLFCPNQRVYHIGKFTLPSVQELRENMNLYRVHNSNTSITFENICADVKDLHLDPSNADAIFQVASQFNCLEMVGPYVSPEEGIERYAADRTQGPICAMACAAGTFYRNYLVPLPNQCTPGQSEFAQVNTMRDIEMLLNNDENGYWVMKNGYLLPVDETSLERLTVMLAGRREEFLSALRVGVQDDTQVTSSSTGHRVSQVFSSAVPIAYDKITPPISSTGVSREESWRSLAELVLEATYEACIAVAALKAMEYRAAGGSQSSRRVSCYLTKVGGGVFRNRDSWIRSAIERALRIHHSMPVDVKLVHYGTIQSEYVGLAA